MYMSGLQGLNVAVRRCGRGGVKSSITELVDCVRVLERKAELTNSNRLAAKRLQQRVTNMDSAFRTYDMHVVDLVEKADDLESKQAALDNHDDGVIGLFGLIAKLAKPGEGEEKHKPDPKRSLQKGC